MIEQFLSQAAGQLGIDETTAKKATGGILNTLQKNSSDSDFSEITNKIDGAGDLANSFSPTNKGIVQTLITKFLGAKGGAAADLFFQLKNSGLDKAQGAGLISMFFGFIQQHVDISTITKVASQVGLDKFLPDLTGSSDKAA